MPIDDPLDAAAQQIAFERRTDSPLSRFIPYLAQLGSPLKAVALSISKREAGRREYLMDNLMDQVRKIRDNHERLDEQFQRFENGKFTDLVLDGLQKSEQTFSKDRIRRIAAILAYAYEVGPTTDVERTEELMRIATMLSEGDVLALRTIYEGQLPAYNRHRGEVSAEEANDFWRLTDPTHRSSGEREFCELNKLPSGVLQSVCGKLQSLGLLARVDRNNFKLSLGITPYALIQRGVEFVESVSSTLSSA